MPVKKRRKATKKQRELTTRYAAVLGTHIKDKDARIIGRRFDQLHKKHGAITAKTILDDARKSRSPLHKYFEWDDTAAAEKWRLNQARKLVQSVRVIIESDGEETKEMRAFVHVVDEERRSLYLPAIEVMDDSVYRRQILDQLKAELANIKRRYSQVLDVAELFDAIDAQLRRVESDLGSK